MHHPSGEEARVSRLRESRASTLAYYQQHLDKVTIVSNETVKSLRGIEESIFQARQQLSTALRESEDCVGKLQSIDRELAKSEY